MATLEFFTVKDLIPCAMEYWEDTHSVKIASAFWSSFCQSFRLTHRYPRDPTHSNYSIMQGKRVSVSPIPTEAAEHGQKNPERSLISLLKDRA